MIFADPSGNRWRKIKQGGLFVSTLIGIPPLLVLASSFVYQPEWNRLALQIPNITAKQSDQTNSFPPHISLPDPSIRIPETESSLPNNPPQSSSQRHADSVHLALALPSSSHTEEPASQPTHPSIPNSQPGTLTAPQQSEPISAQEPTEIAAQAPEENSEPISPTQPEEEPHSPGQSDFGHSHTELDAPTQSDFGRSHNPKL